MASYRLLVVAAAAAAVLVATPASLRPQSPLSLNVRSGGTIPVGSFRSGPDTGGGIDGGLALDVRFALRRGERFFLEAGFGQHRFDCTADDCPGGTYVSTSWDLGGAVFFSLGAVRPFVRAGAKLLHLEREFDVDDGSEDAVSDLGIGPEIGAGVDVSVSRRISVRPELRYVTVDADFDGRATHRLRYLVADLGLVVVF